MPALFYICVGGFVISIAGIFIWKFSQCPHTKLTRPFPAETVEEKSKFGEYGFYSICKICGGHVGFDWGNRNQILNIQKD